MGKTEWVHIVTAVLMMFVVVGSGFILKGESVGLIQVFVFSFVLVFVPVLAKKWAAYLLAASVEHEVWQVYRYGWRPRNHFKSELPFGFIAPLFFVIFGMLFLRMPIWVMTFLTYETRALKHRAAKRFGFYSYTSMTDWHNGLIGAAGVASLWVLSVIGYFADAGLLSKMAAFYAFWSVIPASKLDGTQIFFGSRVLWVVLFLVSLIFALYGLFLG